MVFLLTGITLHDVNQQIESKQPVQAAARRLHRQQRDAKAHVPMSSLL